MDSTEGNSGSLENLSSSLEGKTVTDKYIDVGVNLANKQFNGDRNMVIYRAISEGVTKMITTGVCLRSSQEGIGLAKKYPNYIFPTVGIHPHFAKTCNEETLKRMEDLVKNKSVIAVGECGLDYEKESPEMQRYCFEEQLKLAIKFKKPVILYERSAHDDFMEILRKYIDKLYGVAIHCFTGDKRILNNYIGLGCYIGINGWITDPKHGEELKDMCRSIPLTRLLIGTDAPYTTPYPIKNKRNEPSELPRISGFLSDTIEIEETKLANITRYNTERFFNI